jgi:hypothetical protein
MGMVCLTGVYTSCIVKSINDFFCINNLHGAESPGDIELLAIESAKTGLIQSLVENSGLVTEVHVAHLVAT